MNRILLLFLLPLFSFAYHEEPEVKSYVISKESCYNLNLIDYVHEENHSVHISLYDFSVKDSEAFAIYNYKENANLEHGYSLCDTNNYIENQGIYKLFVEVKDNGIVKYDSEYIINSFNGESINIYLAKVSI